MSRPKTLLDFFSKSPAIKSSTPASSKSDVGKESISKTSIAKSSAIITNNSASDKKAKLTTKSPAVKSPSNSTPGKSKIKANTPKPSTLKISDLPSNGDSSKLKGKRSKCFSSSGSEEEEQKKKNPPLQKVKRRRLVVASETAGSDEYIPKNNGESTEKLTGSSDNASETESPKKKKKKSPLQKVIRRRLVVASETEDSDEYIPENDGDSTERSAGSSDNASETESPKKKKKKIRNKTTPSLDMFTNPKASPSGPRVAYPKGIKLSTPNAGKSPTIGASSSVSTPLSKKKSSKGVSNDTSDEKKGLDADVREYFHEKLEFLMDKYIRDKGGCSKFDPLYDPRTLHVPDYFKKNLTPAMRQWWELKSDHFDAVLFFKVGKFYELYHMDAAIGVKELGLVYMKGDFAHSGFPEIAFGRYSECLIEKGYKVARVEQTETPQMMEERHKKSRNTSKCAKVVAREICQITTKGTKTLTYQDESIGISNNYLFAICEKHVDGAESSSEYGICFVDTSIGKFTLGQFKDDRHGSKLLTLIALYPPVEILYDRLSLTKKTLQLLNHHLTAASKEALSTQFCDPVKTLRFLQKSEIFTKEDESIEYPETLMKMLDPDDRFLETPLKQYEMAFKSFGACLWYLNECRIEDYLLSMKLFEEYIPVDEVQSVMSKSSNDFKKHMVLDGITLQNLEIVPLLSSDNADGTLFGTMDYCSTSFGKRLFRNWLCSPLCNPDMISNRLDAIDDLVQTPEVVEETVAILKKLPDLERLLSKIHAYGLSRSDDHPDTRAIFYEAEIYNKRKINDFLSTLEGFKRASGIISLFKPHIDDLKSMLLRKCTCSDAEKGSFPDMTSELKYFDDAFDHEKAKKQGSIIPSPGVDKEYDLASAEITQTTNELNEFLAKQKHALNCKVSFVGSGKNRFMLEVPENKKVPIGFEFQGGRKGFKRYYTTETRDLLARLTLAEERRASALQDITRRIFAHFDANFMKWKKAVHCLSTLDVLISLVLYYKSSGVPMCRPKFSLPGDDVEPHLEIIDGRHPTFLKYFTGDDYIPNSVYIGPKREDESENVNNGGKLVLVTGPNMGGKSTLMRQAGALVIMAHLGSYVPAESMCLTPVDRIFTRVGASDKISKGESTFFVEASETSSILHHATSDSFVLVDELGRGTATYDGTAIAYAALDYLANDIGCRTLFSTHYHSLVEDFSGHPNVGLGHMACMVEKDCDCPALEKITFLYKFSEGACPKSYGFNVALLAGIMKNIVRQGFLKAQQMEYSAKISKVLRHLLSVKKPEEIIKELDKKYHFF